MRKMLIVALLLAAIGGVGAWTLIAENGGKPAALPDFIGGPFEMVDHTGHKVSDQDYRGRLLLVAFGFTLCPSICPTALQVMADAMDDLGGDAAKVQPLFFTVDPERDTPAVLADYVAAFHPAIVGLTGTPEQAAGAAKAYRVFYRKVDQESGPYLMDHTAVIYLMGADGSYLTYFPHDAPGKAIAGEIRRRLAATSPLSG